jgi:L-aspartate semialdehyde sulfurtransferase
VTMTIGIGIPIPVLNEEIVQYTAVRDEDIWTQIIDYSEGYPQVSGTSLGEVNYAQLKSGQITFQGKQVPTGGMSSYKRAQKIAQLLKDRISAGEFYLAEPVAPIPSADSGISFKMLSERPVKQKD